PAPLADLKRLSSGGLRSGARARTGAGPAAPGLRRVGTDPPGGYGGDGPGGRAAADGREGAPPLGRDRRGGGVARSAASDRAAAAGLGRVPRLRARAAARGPAGRVDAPAHRGRPRALARPGPAGERSPSRL